MSILQAIILGIVQGLTEFLPISSSAHLVLVPFLLGWELPETQVFVFDVLVQVGTLAAVIIYFWKDLLAIAVAFVKGIWQRKPFAETDSRLGWFLILASIPAGIFGLLIKDQVEAAFNSPVATAMFLLVTTLLLSLGELLGRRSRTLEKLTWIDALWIGAAQALSIFPGVSRSGSTIAGGLLRHFDRKSAARFSFLMSIPIMLAAGGLGVKDLLDVPNLTAFLPAVIAGFVAAGVVGYFAIGWLLKFVASHSLRVFAVYCTALALLTFFLAYAKSFLGG